MSEVLKKLSIIQSQLVAPKGQRNTFGNYNYRSCEDILNALKPLLLSNGCTVSLSDDIVLIGDRYYIKATASIKCCETGEVESMVAFAREPVVKKGMDEAQITGATSSYARKYALNGLFAIDDTKDADTDAHKLQENKDKKVASDDDSFGDIASTLDTFKNLKDLNLYLVSVKGKVKTLSKSYQNEVLNEMDTKRKELGGVSIDRHEYLK